MQIGRCIYTPVIKHGLLFLATYGHPAMLVTPDGFWPDQGFFAMLVRSAIFLPDGNPKNCLARFWYIFLNLIATNMLYPTTSSVLHDLWEAMLVMLEKNMLDTSLLDCCYVSRFLVVFKNVLSYQQLWIGSQKEERTNGNHLLWKLKTNNLTKEERTNIAMSFT